MRQINNIVITLKLDVRKHIDAFFYWSSIKLLQIVMLLAGVSIQAVLLAQDDENSSKYFQNFSTLPSAAQSFNQIDNVPLNLFTGQVKVNLPLVEKKLGTLNFNINLLYTGSGGIKIDEPGSTVGRGWMLNTGGVIIRHKRGIPDDFQSHKITHSPPSTPVYENKYNGVLYSSLVAYEPDGSRSLSSADQALDYERGNADCQHDIFEFNFMGRSGKFYIGKNKDVLIAQKSKLKIIPDYQSSKLSGGNIGSFTIIDESGNKFLFNKAISSRKKFEFGYAEDEYAVSWLLTRVEMPSNEESIEFYYKETKSTTIERALFPNETYYKSGKYGVIGYNANDGITLPIYYPAGFLFTSSGLKLPNEFTLTSIKFSDLSTIKLSYLNSSSEAPILNKIDIFNNENKLINCYEFSYDLYTDPTTYIYWNRPYRFGTFYSIRQFAQLKVVKSVSSGGTYKTPYKFDYYSGPAGLNASDLVSLSKINSIDHWGFLNGSSFNFSLLSTLSDNPAYSSSGGSDRSPNLLYSQIGALKSITYPNCGKQEFEYELNEKLVSPPNTTPFNQIVGGLRIKRLILHNGIDIDNDIVKEYKYVKGGGGSSGFLGDMPEYSQPFTIHTGLSTTSINILFSHPVNSLSYIEGSPVGYSRVEEIYKSYGGDNGKIVHEYSDLSYVTNWEQMDKAPYCPADRPTWAIGLPVKVSFYSKSGALVKQIDNVYDIKEERIENDNYRSMQVAKIQGLSGVTEDPFSYYYGYTLPSYYGTNIPSNFYSTYDIYKFKNYYPVIGRADIISTTERIYSSEQANVFKETTKKYVYDDNYFQVRYVETINSKGKKTRKYFYYPFDYNIAAGSFIAQMMEKNMLNTIISAETWLNCESVPLLASASVSMYGQINGNMLRPSNVYSTKYATPMPLSVAGLFNSTVLLPPQRNLQLETSYTRYDQYGRAEEWEKEGGVFSSMILDRSGEILAKADNTRFSQIAYTSFDATTNGNWILNGTKEEGGIAGKNCFSGTLTKSFPTASNVQVTAWVRNDGSAQLNGQNASYIKSIGNWSCYKWILPGTSSITITGTKIDELRCYSQGSLMSTAVYLPDIGVSATCDNTDIFTFYGYDEFNKLSLVKNENAEIIRQTQEVEVQYLYNEETTYNYIFPDGITQVPYTIEKGRFFGRTQVDVDNQLAQEFSSKYDDIIYAFYETIPNYDFLEPGLTVNLNVRIENSVTGYGVVSAMLNGFSWYDYAILYRARYRVNGIEYFKEGETVANHSYVFERAAYFPPGAEILGVTLIAKYPYGTISYYGNFANEYTSYFRKNNCDEGYSGNWVRYEVPITKRISFNSQEDADRYFIQDLVKNGQEYANSIGTCSLLNNMTIINNTLSKLILTVHPKLPWQGAPFTTITENENKSDGTFLILPGTNIIRLGEGLYDGMEISHMYNLLTPMPLTFIVGNRNPTEIGYIDEFNFPQENTLTINP